MLVEEEVVTVSKTDRVYQQVTKNQTIAAFEEGCKRVHVKLPTQTGKTYTTGLILDDPHFRKLIGVKPGEKIRVLWIAHKHRLLTQAKREFEQFPSIELHLQSAFSKLDFNYDWHLTVIDECHHEAMMTLQKKLTDLIDKPIIGLTATDERPDSCLIKFDKTVEALTRHEAVQLGWLAETHVKTVVDYKPSKKKHETVIDIIKNFHHEMQRTLVFMPYRSQCMAVKEACLEVGRTAEVLLDQYPHEVDKILDDFNAGRIDFIINCSKIDEGVDVAGTDVLLAKQSGSLPQLNQIIGRVSKPNSDCRVWEFLHPFKPSLTALDVVGVAKEHDLLYTKQGQWLKSPIEMRF